MTSRARTGLVSAILLAACGGEGGGERTAADDAGFERVAAVAGARTRDSAGVRIVESMPGQHVAEWALEDSPRVRIGSVDGDPRYTLHRVREGLRLGDGRIVVSNAGTELRVYSAAGAHLATHGGAGAGPGEFRAIAGLVAAGDTLFAYDPLQRRLSLIHVDAGFAGSLTIERLHEYMPSPPLLAAALRDGSLAFLTTGVPVPRRELTGLHWVDVPNIVIGRDGSRVDTLGARGLEWMTGGGQVLIPPFARMRAAAAGAGTVVVSSADRYQLEIYDPHERRLAVIARLGSAPPAITRLMWDSAASVLVDTELRAQLGDRATSEDRARLANLARQITPYETVPTWVQLHVDDEGRIWARRWSPQGAESADYDIFDATGALLAAMRLPAGATLLHADREHVMLLRRDEMDVEFVALHRLRK